MMTRKDDADIADSPSSNGAIIVRLDRIDERLARLEERQDPQEVILAELKIDVGIIKATGATKADVAEAKSVVIMWVAGIVFLAQLLPVAARLVEKYL